MAHAISDGLPHGGHEGERGPACFPPAPRHAGDLPLPWCQLAFRGPEICGIDPEEDAGERDLTPRAISNCLRHLEIKPSKRSLRSNSFIKPSIVAGSPISINL